jgi:ABC-type Mn2+/Zn2+ transport system permease subunit
MATWAGLFIGYHTPYPLGFLITSIAFTVYLVVSVVRWVWRRSRVIA